MPALGLFFGCMPRLEGKAAKGGSVSKRFGRCGFVRVQGLVLTAHVAHARRSRKESTKRWKNG